MSLYEIIYPFIGLEDRAPFLGKIWRKAIENFAERHEELGESVTFDCPNLDDFNSVESIVQFALSQVGEYFESNSEDHRVTTEELENILKKLQKYRQPGKTVMLF